MKLDVPLLDRQGLREFGLMTGAIAAVLFGLVLPWLFSLNYPLWPWVLAVILFLWAGFHPQSLHLVYMTWMRIGLLIGSVMSKIILTILFYGLFTPFGFVMRLSGYRPMNEQFEPEAKSYRQPSRPSPAHKMERPF